MNIISGIGESGFLAHSAFSAGIATKDSNGNDITATYLTGVDLTPYQTTAGMTAYMTTGDSAEFMTTAERSDYIPTGVSSEFYTTANTANYISEIPDTYLQNTDLGIENNKITAISGVELSAGTELEFEYDAADNISAINNSAISTTPAQDLYAKSPLYFDVTGTSSYMGINIDTLKRALGIDETILADNISVSATGFTLSEKASNFETIKIYGTYGNFTMLQGRDDRLSWTCDFNSTSTNNRLNRCYTVSSTDGIHWNEINVFGYNQTAFNGNLYLNGGTDWWLETQKIVGIGRKEV